MNMNKFPGVCEMINFLSFLSFYGAFARDPLNDLLSFFPINNLSSIQCGVHFWTRGRYSWQLTAPTLDPV